MTKEEITNFYNEIHSEYDALLFICAIEKEILNELQTIKENLVNLIDKDI